MSGQANGPTCEVMVAYLTDPETVDFEEIYDAIYSRLLDPGGLRDSLHDYLPEGLIVYLTHPVDQEQFESEPVPLADVLELVGVAIQASGGHRVHLEIEQVIDL